MDQEQNQMQSAPQLCRNGCGFYGSSSFDGLCSKCHKDANKKDSGADASATTASTDQGATANLSYVLQETSLLHSGAKSALSVLTSQKSSEDAVPSSLSPRAGSSTQSHATDVSDDVLASSSAVASPGVSGTVPSSPVSHVVCRTSVSALTDSQTSSPITDDETPKKKKSRCDVCRKKVGLTGFSCRCEGLFCSIHRYSDKHNCQFDYRQLGQQEIRKNNPVVVGDKVNKI